MQSPGLNRKMSLHDVEIRSVESIKYLVYLEVAFTIYMTKTGEMKLSQVNINQWKGSPRPVTILRPEIFLWKKMIHFAAENSIRIAARIISTDSGPDRGLCSNRFTRIDFWLIIKPFRQLRWSGLDLDQWKKKWDFCSENVILIAYN